jgi:hypothetical protein
MYSIFETQLSFNKTNPSNERGGSSIAGALLISLPFSRLALLRALFAEAN